MKRVILLFILSCNMWATLDPTFGVGGIVNSLLGSVSARVQAVTIEPLGNIVVTGISNNLSTQRFITARYSSVGVLDLTFNGTGSRITSIGSRAEAQAITLQDDGKIVSAGFAIQGRTDLGLVRYTTLGALDTAFNSSGIVTTSIGTGSQANAMAIQVDGLLNENIVIAGSAIVDGRPQFILARYTPSGALDTTFGTNGIVNTSIGIQASALALLVQTIDSDEKLIAAGYANVDGVNAFALARYNSDGSLDSSFGTGGIVTTPIASDAQITSIALQTDNKIVAVGTVRQFKINKFGIARYNTDGSLDTSFNSTGTQITQVANGSRANAVGIQSTGRIIVGGTTIGDTAREFALAGYTTAGQLDNTFGTNGIEETIIGSIAEIDALAIQTDDKIVAVGFSGNELTIARYLSSIL